MMGLGSLIAKHPLILGDLGRTSRFGAVLPSSLLLAWQAAFASYPRRQFSDSESANVVSQGMGTKMAAILVKPTANSISANTNSKTCVSGTASCMSSRKNPIRLKRVSLTTTVSHCGMAHTKKSLYSGKRVKRGLYRASDNRVLNADVNGAANMLRKSNHRLDFERVARGLFANPLRVKLI